jgi:hypothetical protein
MEAGDEKAKPEEEEEEEKDGEAAGSPSLLRSGPHSAPVRFNGQLEGEPKAAEE